MKLKVIDDFLNSDDYESVRRMVMEDSSFQWMYSEGVDTSDDGYHQLCHIFYSQFEPKSPFFYNLAPIINELRPISIVRIKANLNMKTSEREEYSFHTDVDNCITAIYYVNTNDGYTRFEDGTTVDSVENRMVIFDSNTLHAGCSPTDELRRCLINFNYFV